MYNFLVKNLKDENYSTRGWEGSKIFILYEFVIKYLEPSSIGSSTLRQEIELANQTPIHDRTLIQEQLIKYSNNVNFLKNIHKQLLDNKEKITDIKWGIFQIWKNNTKPLLDTLKIKSENYPFLISSIVIRSSLELLSIFAILKSPKFRFKILEIW
ncbi:hypothetical protein [Spiroplasma endosymbiont of Apeira syringaria]|uniref:hypothetical protein n=1 Tax=Spiroplasma endosymbiont of Apeira syringaria TaxID=3066307 RepID=UPI0030CA7344